MKWRLKKKDYDNGPRWMLPRTNYFIIILWIFSIIMLKIVLYVNIDTPAQSLFMYFVFFVLFSMCDGPYGMSNCGVYNNREGFLLKGFMFHCFIFLPSFLPSLSCALSFCFSLSVVLSFYTYTTCIPSIAVILPRGPSFNGSPQRWLFLFLTQRQYSTVMKTFLNYRSHTDDSVSNTAPSRPSNIKLRSWTCSLRHAAIHSSSTSQFVCALFCFFLLCFAFFCLLEWCIDNLG